MQRYLSIIIPAKNEQETIGLVLKSIRDNNIGYKRYEIILSDNGSTDNTIDIAHSYGCKIVNSKGKTIGEVRNDGAEKALGEILVFLDADCLVEDNWLEKGNIYFDDSHVAAVGAKPKLPKQGNSWVQVAWQKIKYNPNRSRVDWLSSCSIMVRRNIFITVGGFNTKLKSCEDVDLGYKISSQHIIYNDPELSVIHLREPRTINEFFKKEIWHGLENYSGLFSHKIRKSELPSILWPLVTMVACIIILTSVILFNGKLLILGCSLVIFVPALKTIHCIFFKKVEAFYALSTVFLLTVYGIARFFSLIAFCINRFRVNGTST